MLEITPKERRTLRAKAHPLHPVVSIGQQGLTPRVLHEIDVALHAHGLVKVRVFSDDRKQREMMLASIASELDAAPVQHLGKLLILWRPPEEAARPVNRSAQPTKRPAKARRSAGSKRPSNDRTAREPQEKQHIARRARGSATTKGDRFEPDPRRRRSPAVKKGIPHGGGAQASDVRHRRRASGPDETQPRKRPAREAAFGASGAGPASEVRRKRTPSAQAAVRAPMGKSSPNPRRRRRAG